MVGGSGRHRGDVEKLVRIGPENSRELKSLDRLGALIDVSKIDLIGGSERYVESL